MNYSFLLVCGFAFQRRKKNEPFFASLLTIDILSNHSFFHRVYIVIRVFIRLAEYLIARPKHRRLRHRMAQATSYPEWFQAASELDRSQKRDRWLRQVDDHITSKRYNWGFTRELINDMKRARAKEDPLLAYAVLQQCTRKVSEYYCIFLNCDSF